jgi:hypothetical protein
MGEPPRDAPEAGASEFANGTDATIGAFAGSGTSEPGS